MLYAECKLLKRWHGGIAWGGHFAVLTFKRLPKKTFFAPKLSYVVLESDCRREVSADCLSSRKFGG
jgi:hypothetical protein